MEISMEEISNSGNSYMDYHEKERERQELLHSDFLCPVCHKIADEKSWHWGYEICMECFNKGES